MTDLIVKVLRYLTVTLRSMCRLVLYHTQIRTKKKFVKLRDSEIFKDGVLFRVAVGYNLFDGEELLIDSLLSYRPHVHKLFVSYQCLGHYGAVHQDPNLEKTLYYLRDIGLIDELIKFENFEIAKNQTEFVSLNTEKMNMLVSLARQQNCSHFMWVDNDEFFEPKQLNYIVAAAFKVWKPRHAKASGREVHSVGACQHLQYYKSPDFRKKVREGEFIATFLPIDDPLIRFEVGYSSQVSISPERVPNIEKYFKFRRFEVEMHHLSFVRYGLQSKASSQTDSLGRRDPFGIVDAYEAWKFPMHGVWSGGVEFEVARTKPVINIPHFYNHSFAKLGRGESVKIYW